LKCRTDPVVQLDLDLLRTFITVCRSNSFSQAGELLHRTQSAISLQIKRLEDRIGSPVFDRQRRTPALTATGQLLFDYSLRILSLHDEAVSRLEGPNLRGRIRLGILEELGAEVLPSVLESFHSIARASFELHVKPSAELLSLLMSGRLDFVCATGDPDQDAAVTVWHQPLSWVAQRGWRRDETVPLPLVVMAEPNRYCSAAMQALDAAGVPWSISCSATTMVGVIAAVQAGFGVASIDRRGTDARLQAVTSLPILPSIPILLYWGPNQNAEVAARLANHIRQSI
jgi:DNA-binding transcriptional LysR family regulator